MYQMIASITLGTKVHQISIFVEATDFDRKEENKNLHFPL